jgi:hypothetical protein
VPVRHGGRPTRCAAHPALAREDIRALAAGAVAHEAGRGHGGLERAGRRHHRHWGGAGGLHGRGGHCAVAETGACACIGSISGAAGAEERCVGGGGGQGSSTAVAAASCSPRSGSGRPAGASQENGLAGSMRARLSACSTGLGQEMAGRRSIMATGLGLVIGCLCGGVVRPWVLVGW